MRIFIEDVAMRVNGAGECSNAVPGMRVSLNSLQGHTALTQYTPQNLDHIFFFSSLFEDASDIR